MIETIETTQNSGDSVTVHTNQQESINKMIEQLFNSSNFNQKLSQVIRKTNVYHHCQGESESKPKSRKSQETQKKQNALIQRTSQSQTFQQRSAQQEQQQSDLMQSSPSEVRSISSIGESNDESHLKNTSSMQGFYIKQRERCSINNEKTVFSKRQSADSTTKNVNDLAEPNFAQVSKGPGTGLSKKISISAIPNSLQEYHPDFQQMYERHSEVSQGVRIDKVISEVAALLNELASKQYMLMLDKNPAGNNIESGDLALLFEKVTEVQNEKFQKLTEDLDKKVSSLVSQDALENKIQNIVSKLQLQKDNKKAAQKKAILKKQRKKVTESILDISRNNNEFSNFNNLNELGSKNILSDSQNEQSNSSGLQKSSSSFQQSSSFQKHSMQITQLSNRVQQAQKHFMKFSKEIQTKFQGQLKQNIKDVESLNEKIVEWKMKNEEKIQNGFGGVWNIVTDIEDKINKVSGRVDTLEQEIENLIDDGQKETTRGTISGMIGGSKKRI